MRAMTSGYAVIGYRTETSPFCPCWPLDSSNISLVLILSLKQIFRFLFSVLTPSLPFFIHLIRDSQPEKKAFDRSTDLLFMQ